LLKFLEAVSKPSLGLNLSACGGIGSAASIVDILRIFLQLKLPARLNLKPD
jgi:hypothetical protein